MAPPPSAREPCHWERVEAVGDVFTPRVGHAVVGEAGMFYVFGGKPALYSDVHTYEVATNVWRKICANGRAPAARSGAQAVVWNGAVWVFGGGKGRDHFNDVHTYDIATSAWDSVDTLGEAPKARKNHSVVLFRDSMLVFGGFDGRKVFKDSRELLLRERRWKIPTVSRGSLPGGRFGHSAVVYGTSMYVFGGWDGYDTLQELFEYNIVSDTWLPIHASGMTPRSRYRHSAVVCGDAMFIFGGVDKQKYKIPDLHEWNFLLRRWSKVVTGPARPSARSFHKAAVHEGCMYIFGGADLQNLNDTYRIHLAGLPRGAGALGDRGQAAVRAPGDLWTWHRVDEQLGKVYTPRAGHSVVVWKDCFYLLGGMDKSGKQSDIHRYAVRSRSWACVEPVSGQGPSARSGSTAVICRDRIFCYGGYTSNKIGRDYYFGDLFEYNIARGSWARIDTDARSPRPRADHSCVVFEDSLYVFGGTGGPVCFSDVNKYSIVDRRWEERASLGDKPLHRFGHSAVVYREGMFVFGGWNGRETLGDLYELSITTDQWLHVPGRGSVPQPRYRHDAVVHGCCMFVFGGAGMRHTKFSDLCEFSFDARSWSNVATLGAPPAARSFHRAVTCGGSMYILGGFDSARRNDMYKISLPEPLTHGEPRRPPKRALDGDDAAAGPEAGGRGAGGPKPDSGTLFGSSLSLQKRLRGGA